MSWRGGGGQNFKINLRSFRKVRYIYEQYSKVPLLLDDMTNINFNQCCFLWVPQRMHIVQYERECMPFDWFSIKYVHLLICVCTFHHNIAYTQLLCICFHLYSTTPNMQFPRSTNPAATQSVGVNTFKYSLFMLMDMLWDLIWEIYIQYIPIKVCRKFTCYTVAESSINVERSICNFRSLIGQIFGCYDWGNRSYKMDLFPLHYVV